MRGVHCSTERSPLIRGDRNATPYWDAWTTNLPSVTVAERLGFQKVETYPIYFCDDVRSKP